MCERGARRRPVSTPHPRPVRLSRIFRPEDAKLLEEQIPLRRKVAWALVWVGIVIGIALYFTYARLLTPLLAS